MLLIFGSINADLIVPVPWLPQPGETVLGGDYVLAPGGKGANQALAARRAGSRVVLVGAVGQDSFAEVALNLLLRDGVNADLVRKVDQPTGCAAIMVSPAGENMIAVAPGANALVRSEFVPDELLDAETILVAQGEIPLAETGALIKRVRAHGGRSLLNLAPVQPIDPGLYSDIDFLILNEGEAAAMEPPMWLAQKLRRGLIITRGAAGAVAFLADGSRLHAPALAIDPVDTTGAGDTFVGVLAASLEFGWSVELALRRASAAAGLACLARGAQRAMPDAAAIDAAVGPLPNG